MLTLAQAAEDHKPRPYVGKAEGIYPSSPRLDTDGNTINAHGIGIYQEGDTYYMVGEKRTDRNDAFVSFTNSEDRFAGVNLYASSDLINWRFLGTPIVPIKHSLLSSWRIGERPKLYYNALTKKYFILVKSMIWGGFSNQYVISTADHVAGPYTYVGALRFGGKNPATGDVNVFVDDDRSGYLVVPDGKIYKLSDDFLSIEREVVADVWGAAVKREGYCKSEGPGFFKTDDGYFLLGSKGTYWRGSDNFYASAPRIEGPWTFHGMLAPEGTKTWNSQSGFVLPVRGSAGTTYVYMGDRWVNGRLGASTLVWQPLQVHGTHVSLPNYHQGWRIDAAAGTWSPLNTEDGAESINNHVEGSGLYQWIYQGHWSRRDSAGNYANDVSESSTKNDTAMVGFVGTQIYLYTAISDRDLGIMGITLLDALGRPLFAEQFVSLRTDAGAQGNYLSYASPVLPKAEYKLRVRVTGLKDRSSKKSTIAIDRVMIMNTDASALHR